MARKKLADISVEDFLRDNLQEGINKEFGCRSITGLQMPEYFASALNPRMPLRPYQREAFQYFFTYWNNDFDAKPNESQLLFHMATGSGKTLIMAGLILFLYEKGYRNFLFFVNNGNVIEKTKDNFFNTSSSKYLFAPSIDICGKRVEIRQVRNFQESDPDAINFCLQTIQGVHSYIREPGENVLTNDDFKVLKVVLISDEAHHINTATKRGVSASQMSVFDHTSEEVKRNDWESTVMQIFNSHKENVLLEFTATEDFTNPAIADKYRNRVIYDYSLKRFREDGYSKEISLIQSDRKTIDRALQAVLMSQFRRKLSNCIRQDIKPVVMFKSKTIKENKAFYDEFIETVRTLDAEDLLRLRQHARDGILDAFRYFDAQKISADNLLLEIKEDFKEENLLLVDGSSISAYKQQRLNSLESKDNELRAVFAVDMLNEGWDVLNLFDIVRLYDTRSGVGKTTNSEAQLIGRGARYMPFEYNGADNSGFNEHMEESAYKRKFDHDLDNPLRYLEMLSYHSPSNTKYIQELNSALASSGIIESKSVEVTERLKDEFKQSRLYKHGYVFTNCLETEAMQVHAAKPGIGSHILDREYKVRLSSEGMKTSFALSDVEDDVTISSCRCDYTLGDFGINVLRSAINRFPLYSYDSLHKIFPELPSIRHFIESSDYLQSIRVIVYGREEHIKNLSQKDRLAVVIEVLSQIEPLLDKRGIRAWGSSVFTPAQLRDVFHDHRYRVAIGSDSKEEGVSMRETDNDLLRLDLRKVSWYAYDDNYGTEEEKFLIKYVESIVGRLQKEYSEIWLLRNYKDFKLYAFDDGRATEPDFVLFLRKKGEEVYENKQIFIESKGRHLRATDMWKATFLKDIQKNGMIDFTTGNDNFGIAGMPFYTHDVESEFVDAMEDIVLP